MTTHTTTSAAMDPDATGPRTDPPTVRRHGVMGELVRLSRARQWSKNLLVVSAPAAAGALDQGPVLRATALAVLAFVAASVAVYAFNDVVDAPADRQHPTKWRRPVAARTLAPAAAGAWAGACAAAALTVSAFVGPVLVLVIGGYLLLGIGYALWLKHRAVLDIMGVAAGFVLRALAGAAATHVVPSNWFLLVSLFGALYLVAGKRAGEARSEGGSGSSGARPVLAAYPQVWLDQVVTVALTGTTLSYAMWAFQDVGTDVFKPLLALSVVPFLLALLRYGLLLAHGKGEEPERLVVTDLPLLAAGVAWVAVLALGLYAA